MAKFVQIPVGKLHICEHCRSLHTSGNWGTQYSTGRFCSRRCARAYATSARRKEINARVSATLKGRKQGQT